MPLIRAVGRTRNVATDHAVMRHTGDTGWVVAVVYLLRAHHLIPRRCSCSAAAPWAACWRGGSTSSLSERDLAGAWMLGHAGSANDRSHRRIRGLGRSGSTWSGSRWPAMGYR